MQRRHLLSVVGLGLSAAAASAQTGGRRRRIGVLTPAARQWESEPFVEELQRHGLREGGNIDIVVLSSDGDLQRLPELARTLVDQGIELIVAVNTPGTQAAIGASATLPIVIAIVADPVLLGFVSNFSRPGGRITGVANMSVDIAPKRLQILKEAIPAMRRALAVYQPDDAITQPQIERLSQTAPELGIEVTFAPARNAAELEAAVGRAAGSIDAIFRLAGQSTSFASDDARLALQHRLPMMATMASGVRDGALLSYFADHHELWRRAAHQVARILNGERVGDLPFERATKFDLTINLRTARALGLTLPPAILARADEIIE